MYGALGWRELEDLGKNFPTSHYLSVITECLFICPEEHVTCYSHQQLEYFIKFFVFLKKKRNAGIICVIYSVKKITAKWKNVNDKSCGPIDSQ